MDRAHVAWCRNLFSMMQDGGVWGVPRSGLLFRKEDGTLVLIGRMPWEEGMPISASLLRAQQDSDYEGTKEHFEAAGVKVIDRA